MYSMVHLALSKGPFVQLFKAKSYGSSVFVATRWQTWLKNTAVIGKIATRFKSQ